MNYYKNSKKIKETNMADTVEQQDLGFGYYSRVLKQDFNTLEELRAAEAKYAEEQAKKEEAAKARKADADKVNDAFKAMNAAMKTFKKDKAEVTQLYHEALKGVQLEYKQRLTAIEDALYEAEQNYKKALKEFTEKNKNGYHLTLKDDDGYETTLNYDRKSSDSKAHSDLMNIFDLLFNF